MKKILTIALCFTFVFACGLAFARGGGNQKETGTKEGPAEKIELHLYSIDTNPEQSLNDLIAGFENEFPQYKVVFHGFERARYDEAVRTAVTGGEPTDILLMDGQFVMSYINDDLIYPAEDYVDFKDRYAKGVLDTITHEGKVWAVPWESVVCLIWINQDVFDKYNLPVPETWSDMLIIRDKLKGTGIAPFVYPSAQVWWMPMLVFVTLPDFTDNDPIGYTMETMRGEHGYDSPPYIKAYKRIQSMVTEDILIKGSTGIDFDGAIQLLVQGKAAMFYMGNWAMPTIKSAVANEGSITTTWVPHDPGNISQPAGGPGFCMTISKQTKNLEGAKAFVQYISRDESAFLTASRRGSPTSDVKGDERAAKELNDALWLSIVPYFQNVVVFYDWLWEPEITKEFQVQIQALLTEQITPEECGALIQKKFEELRDEGRAYYWK